MKVNLKKTLSKQLRKSTKSTKSKGKYIKSKDIFLLQQQEDFELEERKIKYGYYNKS